MKKTLYAAAIIVGLGAAGFVMANHSWGGYHWARTTATFNLKLGDNVNTVWDNYLRSASTDWNTVQGGFPQVITTSVVAGATNAKNCKAVPGTVQVCNSTYGNNGWLGIAQIWISGGHITQGTTKMNDTYFNTAKYNTPAWRNMVVCQEIAHTFGLDHQDEAFGNVNVGSCMDYTNAPAGGTVGGFDYGPSNEHPNLHDFEELATIYSHVDSTNTFSSASATNRGNAANAQSDEFANASEWGSTKGHDSNGRASTFERDLGNGDKLITHVIWVE